MRRPLSERTEKRSDNGKNGQREWSTVAAVSVALLLLLAAAAIISPDARAGDGTPVGAQCWINGKLVGPFPLDRPCPGTEGGGGHTIIMGPPVIVWRRPSAEGSQMTGLAPVDSGLAGQLNAIADTPITLRQKGEFAMRNGDLARAKLYLEEASRRDPQDPQIQQSLAKLRGLFDSGTQSLKVPRLKLPEQEFLKPMPAATVNRFMGDPGVRALREAEIISYNRLANADAALNTMKANAQTGEATQKDVDRAQLKLNAAVEEFKKAETKLKEKIYVLDK